MTQELSPQDLGEPDLKVAGFQLWVHGRQFPDAQDCDDGNWLRVTAHCGASGASVWAQGAIVMTLDIEGFAKQCRALLQGEATCAALDPLEPELRVALETTDTRGHLRARVEITSDHLAQSHKLEFDIDQSHLPGIINVCARILEKHPVRGQRHGGG
jgi:hypothetical protein